MRHFLTYLFLMVSILCYGKKIESSYYENGQLKEYREWIKYDLVFFTSYHPNGQLKQRGTYAYGLPHGEWKEYDSQGELKCSAFYMDGIKEGLWLHKHIVEKEYSQVDYVANQIMSHGVVPFPLPEEYR